MSSISTFKNNKTFRSNVEFVTGEQFPSLRDPTTQAFNVGQRPKNVCVGFHSQVTLGGQAPLFIDTDVVDSGLVRIGGQSPLL